MFVIIKIWRKNINIIVILVKWDEFLKKKKKGVFGFLF